MAWARRHGGVFSLNHPFSKYNRVDLDDPQREQVLEEMIRTYVASGASGADTLEVGFPAGRHNFALDYYLRLWDGLSRAGIVIAGSGSSDAHSARVGWQNGNNFATHIRADTTDEAALLTGLRARDIYPADPVRFRSKLSFTDDAGHRMGEVVAVRAAAEREVRLSLDRAQPSWHLVWVLNGERRPAVPLPEGAVDRDAALRHARGRAHLGARRDLGPQPRVRRHRARDAGSEPAPGPMPRVSRTPSGTCPGASFRWGTGRPSRWRRGASRPT